MASNPNGVQAAQVVEDEVGEVIQKLFVAFLNQFEQTNTEDDNDMMSTSKPST